MSEFHPLPVARVDRLCEDAAAVTFDVPAALAERYRFHAGQAVLVRRVVDGEEHRRHYSICSAPGDAIRVGVRAIPDGVVSDWLVGEVAPGDTVEVEVPSGKFGAEEFAAERHLAIVAGSGITPVLSIMQAALAVPGSTFTLLYGNRTHASVMFVDELADLKDEYGPRLEIVHVLSREPRDVELFSGRLDPERLALMFSELVDLDRTDQVWLCGPFDLIQGARGVLDDFGYPEPRTHFELFYVDEPPPLIERKVPESGETSAVSVTLDGRTATLQVPFDEPLLDAMQHQRADLPFACKGGVCGTCRAKVTDGKVEMTRNYALDPSEVDGGFVLTCQSYPVTAEITLDYDA